jgi:DNA-binding transcriptional LysR family regulator
MDRLEAMTLLLATVEHGSLSAAGRALGVPVATLSRKLSELEARLDARLLTRTTRRLTLTDAGTGYVAAARRILEQVEEAEREAAGEFSVPKGRLVVTAPIHFGRRHVLPLVVEFLAQFAAIDVRLVLSDRNVDLVDDQIDMAVRIGRLPDSAMVATRVGSMRTVTCASPALLAARGTPRAPADLQHWPSIAVDTPMPAPAWANTPRLAVSTSEAAVDAAVRGAGVTRQLYYQVADAVRTGELVIVLEAFEPDPAPIHLLHAARGQMPLKTRRFLDFAAPRLRATLELLAAEAPGRSA